MAHLTGGRAGIAALALVAALALGARGAFSGTASAPPSALDAVAFSSPTTGYGLFEQQASATCTYSVGTTADGGARFTALARVSSRPCAGGAPAGSLAFDTAGDGFLYGPKLFTSHDGGASWAPSPQPGSVLAIDAVGRSVWMLEQVCAGASAMRCPLRLLESADGGRSFTPSPRQPAATPQNAADGSALGQSWLVRVSAAAAYVLAPALVSTSSRPAAGAPLLYTDDGGSSWSRRHNPCGRSGESVLSAAPGGALFAVCAGVPGAGKQAKSTAVSTDGGRSWSVHAPCPNLNTCRTPLAYGYLGVLDATSASTAYAIGDRSALLVTRDGGRSWSALGDVGDVNGEPAQVEFFGPRDGLVLGRTDTVAAAVTIWDTSDGGRSWTPVVPSTS